MNKKTVLGTAAVLVVAGYGAATWTMAQRAHGAYQEALDEVRKLVGPEVLVSQQYTKGFWSSQGQLVLQWTPPAPGEDDEEEGDAAAIAAVPQPVRITVENTVRHGPLAGWRLAAAVVETRVSNVEGVDDTVRKAFAKVSAPTLTTVRSLTGSYDIALAWPAGEVGDGEELVRWQPLIYKMALNADRSRLSGDYAWPEITMNLQGKSDDSDDEPASAASPSDRFAVAMQGMKGDFNFQLEDGLWLLAPGSGKGTFGKVTVTRAAATTAAASAAPEPLVALQDLSYGVTIARTGAHLGWVTTMRGTGSVGPVALEALEFNETVSRIDVEGVKLVQQALLDAYRADPGTVLSAAESPASAALMEAVPKFLAALPAYAMKLSAKVDGEQGELEYGVELKSAPDPTQIAEGAWVPAMLKSGVLHASVRVPKAWLPRLAQAAGQKAPKPEDIDAMLGMAQAQGFVKQEGTHLTSAVRMEDSKVVLNGKPIDLPMMRR
jgi:uncharacterized protein YdgA (DUF945 family)